MTLYVTLIFFNFSNVIICLWTLGGFYVDNHLIFE